MTIPQQQNYCHCGCGGNTVTFRGKPRKFINGHQRKICLPIEDAYPFKIDGDKCRIIPLSNGIVAIVLESDYQRCMANKWTAKWFKRARSFYAITSVSAGKGKRKDILLHRFIFGLKECQGQILDHENRNSLDNRGSNIRIATHGQNRMNSRTNSNNQSGFKGIYQKGIFWEAWVSCEGKRHYAGRSKDPEVAYEKWKSLSLQLQGTFSSVR